MTRAYAPAAARNRDPILAVLRRLLPAVGTVLEIASGTGEHALHFARALPGLLWCPSDPSDEARASIAAWIAHERTPNIAAPRAIDVVRPGWHASVGTRVDAIVCINMIHIAPWSACLGLLDGAAALLAPGHPLVLYGPYMRDGAHTAPSNAAFDASLRARDPAWGVRDLDQVSRAAAERGLEPSLVEPMPANNLTVAFVRRD